jgi:hypothetical protein
MFGGQFGSRAFFFLYIYIYIFILFYFFGLEKHVPFFPISFFCQIFGFENLYPFFQYFPTIFSHQKFHQIADLDRWAFFSSFFLVCLLIVCWMDLHMNNFLLIFCFVQLTKDGSKFGSHSKTKIANSKKKLVYKIYRYSHVWRNKNVHTNSKRSAPCFARVFFLKVTLGYNRRRLKTLVANNRGLRHTKKATSRV